MAETRLLFVCLGNICRSPLAEGAFRRLIDIENKLDHYIADSAGFGRWHAGARVDRRALAVGQRRGIDLSRHRARRIEEDDFRQFDLILAMDRQGLNHLRALAPAQAKHKVQLLLDYAPWLGVDAIPDPVRCSTAAFDDVMSLIEYGVRGLLFQMDQSRAALESS